MSYRNLRKLIREMFESESYDEPTRDEMRTEEFQTYTSSVWKIYKSIKHRVRGKHIVLMQLIKDPPSDIVNVIDSTIIHARRNRDFDPSLVRKFYRPGRFMSDLRKMAEMEREYMVSLPGDEDIPRFSDDDDMTPL